MTDAASSRARPHPAPPASLEAQFVVSSVVLAGLILLVERTIWPERLADGRLLPLLVFGVACLVAWVGVRQGYPHARWGLCNVVTQLRAALVALLAGALAVPGVLVAAPELAWAGLGVALVALLLDGIDGWLARRAGLVSNFGARFDVEVDAALALILSVLVLQSGKAEAWVLLLGLARYAFVVTGAGLSWMRAPLPPRLRRKVVCVLQLGALTAMVAPPVAPPLSALLAIVAALALAGSFGADLAWLWRRRAAA